MNKKLLSLMFLQIASLAYAANAALRGSKNLTISNDTSAKVENTTARVLDKMEEVNSMLGLNASNSSEAMLHDMQLKSGKAVKSSRVKTIIGGSKGHLATTNVAVKDLQRGGRPFEGAKNGVNGFNIPEDDYLVFTVPVNPNGDVVVQFGSSATNCFTLNVVKNEIQLQHMSKNFLFKRYGKTYSRVVGNSKSAPSEVYDIEDNPLYNDIGDPMVMSGGPIIQPGQKTITIWVSRYDNEVDLYIPGREKFIDAYLDRYSRNKATNPAAFPAWTAGSRHTKPNQVIDDFFIKSPQGFSVQRVQNDDLRARRALIQASKKVKKPRQ